LRADGLTRDQAFDALVELVRAARARGTRGPSGQDAPEKFLKKVTQWCGDRWPKDESAPG
jgi:hypothetical protein